MNAKELHLSVLGAVMIPLLACFIEPGEFGAAVGSDAGAAGTTDGESPSDADVTTSPVAPHEGGSSTTAQTTGASYGSSEDEGGSSPETGAETSENTTGVSDGTSSAGTTESGEDPPLSQCDAIGGDCSTCTDCAAAAGGPCTDEAVQCETSTACQEFLTCYSWCMEDDGATSSECFDHCYEEEPEGAAVFDAWVVCTAAECAVSCGLQI